MMISAATQAALRRGGRPLGEGKGSARSRGSRGTACRVSQAGHHQSVAGRAFRIAVMAVLSSYTTTKRVSKLIAVQFMVRANPISCVG